MITDVRGWMRSRLIAVELRHRHVEDERRCAREQVAKS
jgi:hypothetical protein